MLTICCVMVSNYCGLGAQYVNALHRAVERNMTIPHRFVCFTDDPTGIECETEPVEGDGWFAKLHLFKKFNEGQVVFFDLDTLIVGNLDFLAKFNGKFAILQDFYRPKGYGSGMMSWRAPFGHEITEAYVAAGEPDVPGGDQAFIERKVKNAKRLQEVFPRKIVSYKAHALAGVPLGAAVVCFHGYPKPHDFQFGWVRDVWAL